MLVLERGSVRREGNVEAGVVFVDGLGIGDPKDAVLRDRRQLSADGTLIIVCQLHRGPSRVEPEVIARGFAPEGADAADELIDEVRAHASRSSTASTPTACASTSCSRATCTTSSPSSSGTARASGRWYCPSSSTSRGPRFR